METKSGILTVVDYNEETGVLSVDIDTEGVKMLTSYALNALLREYCEPILETEEESGRDETPEELKDMYQSTEQAAQDIRYETKDIPL